jgi:hypothetical protein
MRAFRVHILHFPSIRHVPCIPSLIKARIHFLKLSYLTSAVRGRIWLTVIVDVAAEESNPFDLRSTLRSPRDMLLDSIFLGFPPASMSVPRRLGTLRRILAQKLGLGRSELLVAGRACGAADGDRLVFSCRRRAPTPTQICIS